MELAYGPVPSRRLGQSLGINNVPPKTCTYACVYCQLGTTAMAPTDLQSFHSPEAIENAVERRIQAVRNAGESIDYLTFVPDGEPTLDVSLGETIDRLGRFDVDIAVLTNGSLLWKPAVRDGLADVDWISVKVDAGTADVWRRIDRPHESLSFERVIQGIESFAESFSGTLTTETMLVDGINSDETRLRSTASLVADLSPDTAFLAVPTRPPAEDWVEPPPEQAVAMAYRIFEEHVDSVEYLIGAEGDTFASTGDAVADILGVTAVHPMRKPALEKLLARDDAEWEVVEGLLGDGELMEIEYGGETFYMQPIARKPA